jgi:hypothetical protein
MFDDKHKSGSATPLGFGILDFAISGRRLHGIPEVMPPSVRTVVVQPHLDFLFSRHSVAEGKPVVGRH